MIFGPQIRSNWKSKLYRQSAYEFINESAWPVCEIARSFYNEWCQQFSADNAFVSRLKSKDDKQHAAAFFELLIFALFKSASFTITTNAVLRDSKTTDFTLTYGQKEVLLECSLAGNALEAIEEKRKKDSVLQYLEEVPSFPYYININFKKLSATSISKRELLAFLRAIAAENPQLVAGESSGDYCFCGQGWGLVLSLIRKPQKSHDRTLGPVSQPAKMVDNSRVLLTALNDKKPSKYAIDGKPYIICIGVDDISAGEEEFSHVLFGANYPDQVRIHEQSSGFFLYNGHPINTSVSAVLFCDRVSVFGFMSTAISIWHNPYAANKLTPGQFPVKEFFYFQDHGVLHRHTKENSTSLLELLGIDGEAYREALKFENRKAPVNRHQ